MPIHPFGEVLESIKRRLSIVALADALGLAKIRRTGINHTACCPFHQDRTPSLTLYEETRTYHCFACEAHGDAFDLVRKMRSCDFAEAARWLADYTHTPLPAALPASHRQSGLSLAAKAYEAAAVTGRQVLKRWAEEERRLDLSTVKKAGLVGIASPVLTGSRHDGAHLAGWDRWEWNALEEAGMVRTRRHKGEDSQGALPLSVPEDVFWYEGILFPMNTPTGALAGFAVRKTTSSKYEGPKYRYSSGFKRSECLYGLDRLYARLRRKGKDGVHKLDVFLVEGLVDVLRMESLGLDAVGVLGNAVSGSKTDEASQVHHLWALKQQYPEAALHVHLFFDADDPGQQGMYRVLRKLLPLQAEDPLLVVDCIVPDVNAKGKDPDELLVECDPNSARTLLQTWAVSSAQVGLARVLDIHASQLDSAWATLSGLQKVQAIARCSRMLGIGQHAGHPELLCSGGLFDGHFDHSAKEWAVGLLRPLLAPAPTTSGTAQVRRIPAVQRDEGFARALLLARESYSDIDFAIDTGSWARLELGGELVWPVLQKRLEDCRPPLEPFSATLTPRFDGGQPRLKTLPAPEDLVLENFVLGHLLRFGVDNPRTIPLVVHDREAGATVTVGLPELLPIGGETVSFAYQFNQNAFCAGTAQSTGLFRHFSECWHGFIDFILNRIQSLPDSVESVYVARLDIRRYYDTLSRTTVLDALTPALRVAIEASRDGMPVVPFLDDAARTPDDRVSRFRRWMLEGRTFGYSWYAPDDGHATPWPDPDRGIPQGPHLSSWLANVALFPLDRQLTQVVEGINRKRSPDGEVELYATYARYVDDIVIIAPSKSDFDVMRLSVSGWLESKGLQFSKKIDALPPMDRSEVQAWLLENRGLAERASGDWSLPEAPVEVRGAFGRLAGGKMDRHDALVLLHSADATDPVLARKDALTLIETVAQSSAELRYADYRAIARNLWYALVAEDGDTSTDLDAIASEYWRIWNSSVVHGSGTRVAQSAPSESSEAVDGFARAIDQHWSLMVCLEALQKVLMSRRDRNPLLAEESHRVGAKVREHLASMVLVGLVDRLISAMPRTGDSHDRSIDNIATMLLARRLALYRVAALIAGRLALPVRNDEGFSRMPGALDPGSYRLALSTCPPGMLQDHAPYSSAVGESGDRRAILLFHEAIERLRHSGPVDRPSDDPLRPIGTAIEQQTDAASPSDLDRALGLLIPRDAPAKKEDGIAIRVLNVFARAVPAGNQLRLLEWRKPLVGAFKLGSRYSIIPTPEGLATVALLIAKEGEDEHIERCCVITVRDTDDDGGASLAPEDIYPLPSCAFGEWKEDTGSDGAPSCYRCYSAVRTGSSDAELWTRPAQARPKGAIAAADLSLIANAFTQLSTLPRIAELVLTHAHVLQSHTGQIAPFSWVDTIGQLAGKACSARSDGQGSLLIDVPQQNDWVWRVGHAVIGYVGLSWLVDQSEDCRITRPANENLGEWAASSLALMAARSLTGAYWWSKTPPHETHSHADSDSASVLPRVVSACLSRLTAFVEMAKSPSDDPIPAVGLVLAARADNALMRQLFETRALFDRPGLGPLVLSRLGNLVVRADEGLIDLLVAYTPAGSRECDRPLRRAVAAHRALFRHILAITDRIGDEHGRTSVDCLAQGVAVVCVSNQLRAFVMESTNSRVNLRSVCLDHANEIRTWPLDGASLLCIDIEPLGGAFEAVTALAERFDISRGGASAIRSHSEYAKVTPLGWAVLWRLAMLHADPLSDLGGGDDSERLNLLLQVLSSVVVPARENYPSGCIQRMDQWNSLEGLDESLRLLVDSEHRRGLVVRNACKGRNPVTGHGRDSVDLLSESGDEWQIDSCQFLRAALPGEKPSDYERKRSDSGPWCYSWSESWCEGRLVGASMISVMFGRLVSGSEGSDLGEAPTPLARQSSASGSGSEHGREEVAEQVSVVPGSDHQPEKQVCLPRHPGDDRESHEDDAKDALRSFRRKQAELWRSRRDPYGNHLRVALYQFDVDESYSHPLSEACLRRKDGSIDASLADVKSRALGPGASWVQRAELFSCAEARRRGLLAAALRACVELNVEILLLPEYSVRAETLGWIAHTLDECRSDMRVWAGTFRIPSSGMDTSSITGALAPGVISHLFHPSASVLAVVSRSGVETARGKRYPSVALGEQFKPFLNDGRSLSPLFVTEPPAGLRCLPGHFVTELICSEIFMATSPANLNSITQSLRRLYGLYAPSALGRDLSFISEAALRDLQEFADHTSMAPRYDALKGNHNAWKRYPRRTVLLVPGMSTRSVDFHILGQANYLAAGMCMAFCNAVCSPFARGESCFIGQGATRGDSNHRFYDERLGYTMEFTPESIVMAASRRGPWEKPNRRWWLLMWIPST